MISLEKVTFSYGKENSTGGVKDIDLTISKGETVVLCGESGCGKTTLIRMMNGLIPHYYEGELTGKVRINGQDAATQPLYKTAAVVGSVFQNPRSQFFSVDTTSEVVFGCENLGVPKEEIQKRLDKTVRDFSLAPLMGRSIFELSGGEKQKIACAGVSMMQPEIYLLDEPSSNLDVDSISQLRQIIARWKSEGKTIVISEHRLYYLRGLADRFIYLKNGKITGDFSADEFEALGKEREEMGLRAFDLQNLRFTFSQSEKRENAQLKKFRFGYRRGEEKLAIDSADIPYGRITGIIGNNGAGKSTFARCFCGLEKRCGEVTIGRKTFSAKDRLSLCYMVMQETGHQLFTESVLDEVLVSMEPEDETRAGEILEQLDLKEVSGRHPLSLSGGQKQRTAIASAIASMRKILFLDEPTSGLDRKHMLEVAKLLRCMQSKGISIYVITHDVELIAACCTDLLYFQDGKIADCYPMNEEGVQKCKAYFLNGIPS